MTEYDDCLTKTTIEPCKMNSNQYIPVICYVETQAFTFSYGGYTNIINLTNTEIVILFLLLSIISKINFDIKTISRTGTNKVIVLTAD